MQLLDEWFIFGYIDLFFCYHSDQYEVETTYTIEWINKNIEEAYKE